jgi:hypothetical protein
MFLPVYLIFSMSGSPWKRFSWWLWLLASRFRCSWLREFPPSVWMGARPSKINQSIWSMIKTCKRIQHINKDR